MVKIFCYLHLCFRQSPGKYLMILYHDRKYNIASGKFQVFILPESHFFCKNLLFYLFLSLFTFAEAVFRTVEQTFDIGVMTQNRQHRNGNQKDQSQRITRHFGADTEDTENNNSLNFSFIIFIASALAVMGGFFIRFVLKKR